MTKKKFDEIEIRKEEEEEEENEWSFAIIFREERVNEWWREKRMKKNEKE